jgi:hypothetical protein
LFLNNFEPILAIYLLKNENWPKGTLTSRITKGQMVVTSKMYIIIYRARISISKMLISFLPTKPVRLPPKAKMMRINTTCHPFACHFFCKFLNIALVEGDEIRS